MAKLLSLVRLVAAFFLLVIWASCGEDGKPQPGYSDPCSTPMAGVLNCPPGAQENIQDFTIYDACEKMVSCGILARSYLRNEGPSDCPEGNTCDIKRGGECLVLPEGGTRCHFPYLDYWWCTSKFTQGLRSDPCATSQESNLPYTAQHLQQALRCIAVTPCAPLGLTFEDKRISSDKRPELDKYTCKDGKTKVWTATICDFGLLSY